MLNLEIRSRDYVTVCQYKCQSNNLKIFPFTSLDINRQGLSGLLNKSPYFLSNDLICPFPKMTSIISHLRAYSLSLLYSWIFALSGKIVRIKVLPVFFASSLTLSNIALVILKASESGLIKFEFSAAIFLS